MYYQHYIVPTESRVKKKQIRLYYLYVHVSAIFSNDVPVAIMSVIFPVWIWFLFSSCPISETEKFARLMCGIFLLVLSSFLLQLRLLLPWILVHHRSRSASIVSALTFTARHNHSGLLDKQQYYSPTFSFFRSRILCETHPSKSVHTRIKRHAEIKENANGSRRWRICQKLV